MAHSRIRCRNYCQHYVLGYLRLNQSGILHEPPTWLRLLSTTCYLANISPLSCKAAHGSLRFYSLFTPSSVLKTIPNAPSSQDSNVLDFDHLIPYASQPLAKTQETKDSTHQFHGSLPKRTIPIPPESKSQKHLRLCFDDPSYYPTHERLATCRSMGFFRNPLLNNPMGLSEFARLTKASVMRKVDEMILQASTSRKGKLQYIKRLDAVSDSLCRVIDAAECLRLVHGDQDWALAAQQTHEYLFEYMNELNTNVSLFSHLRDILADADLCKEFSYEELTVGKHLLQDFEQLGIHMPKEKRRQFVQLTQHISVLGSQYCEGQQKEPTRWIYSTRKMLDGILESTWKSIASWLNQTVTDIVSFPLHGAIPYDILRHARDKRVRARAWLGLYSAEPTLVSRLDEIASLRRDLAHLLGFPSFCAYQLQYKMARDPENVQAFLSRIKEQKGAEYVASLGSLGITAEQARQTEPWSIDYLQSQNQDTQSLLKKHNTNSLEEYFSVGTVMLGLARLFLQLYNVTLRAASVAHDEVWSDNVRKIGVYDHDGQVMGYLYIEFGNPRVLPLHFTVVCLREFSADTAELEEQYVHLCGTRQVPVVTVVFNFGNSTPKAPALLNPWQTSTVFHEMGHAMHLMLGRTALHNLLGTRCATDFVEFPLILMERFAMDERVMRRIGRHYQTDEQVPLDLWRKHCAQHKALEAADAYQQIKLAQLDHNIYTASGSGPVNTTDIYHATETLMEFFPDKWLTMHAKNQHLFLYGAVYYLYVFDRAIADRVWNTLFEKDPWNAAAGERYRNAILKWGGTRDPWHCLADALLDERLVKGDAAAMRILTG